MNGGDLTAWASVKALLNLDDDQEQKAEFLITQASMQAEKFAARFLAARDISVKLDGHGGRELLIPGWPVNAVTRLCIDPCREFPPENDVPAGEYGVKNDSGIVRLYKRRFPFGFDCVLFEGNIGYNPVPEDLQFAVIETVSHNLRRLGPSGGQVGIKSWTDGNAVTTAFEIDVPVSSRNVFLSYRGARI